MPITDPDSPSPHSPTHTLGIDPETFGKLIDEYTGAELAQIFRAMNGTPEPVRDAYRPDPESAWPWVAFWLAAAAVAITWILQTR